MSWTQDALKKYWWMTADSIGVCCANPHCENPVPSGRRLFCCKRCGRRAWDIAERGSISRATLRDELAEVKEMQLRMFNMLESISANPAPKQLEMFSAKPKSSAPLNDDDLIGDVQSAKRSADSNATWNFLISSAINVYGTIDGLPKEAIEYGIRTNRIPEHMQKAVKKEAPKGPKKMDVPDVAAPDLDDLDLDFDLNIEIAS